MRRIPRGRDQLARLVSRFDHRNQQRLHPDIEILLDEDGIADRQTHHRVHRIATRGLQLAEHGAQIVGTMLSVEQQPVKAGAGQDLDNIRVRERGPHADLLLPGGESCFE